MTPSIGRILGIRVRRQRTAYAVRALWGLALVALLAPRAAAAPLDLDDPTPRPVDVEFDQESDDFTAQGGSYSTPLRGSFESDGNIAYVTISGPDLAVKIDQLLGGILTTLPETFSDYVIAIEVATRAVLAADASGTIHTDFGDFDVTQIASSAEVAGFRLADIFGYELPAFCMSGALCTIVPGAPYDPATGRMNAVGVITGAVVDFFTPFGDIRLREAEAISCDTAVGAAEASNGDSVSLELALRNDLLTDQAVEIKVWADPPDGPPANLLSFGSEGGAKLVAAQVLAFPSGPLFTVNAATARGVWSFGCRILDPATGETLDSDVDSVQVLDPLP